MLSLTYVGGGGGGEEAGELKPRIISFPVGFFKFTTKHVLILQIMTFLSNILVVLLHVISQLSYDIREGS